MKKKLALLFVILIYSCATKKITTKDTYKYFDENNIEISKAKFDKNILSFKFFEIPGDSIHHKKLINREQIGKIKSRENLELLIEKEINQEIDSNKPIIIIFYPGKDPCNSGGSSTVKALQKYYEILEKGVYQIAQIKPIYIYKDKEGLEIYEKFLNWNKDPGGIVESQFFKHHYPCFSFVVIGKNGRYFSYFGEFVTEYLWKATQYFSK